MIKVVYYSATHFKASLTTDEDSLQPGKRVEFLKLPLSYVCKEFCSLLMAIFPSYYLW